MRVFRRKPPILCLPFVFSIVAIFWTVLKFMHINNGGGDGQVNLRSNNNHPIVQHTEDTVVLWQIPDSPRFVLFVAHGCGGHPGYYWDRSPTCPNCVGMPEERLLVREALRLRYAVIGISSLGKCWSFGKEVTTVKQIISGWIERHPELNNLPVFGLGASSGGHFLSILATKMKFRALTLVVAQGLFKSMSDVVLSDYPPTLFVHMPKDDERMRVIMKYMELLSKKGVAVKEIRCMEFPITPHLLSDRIPGVDQGFSIKLFQMFRELGFIDDHGYMKKDGRKTPWKDSMAMFKSDTDRYRSVVGHIQQELNLAFAYHEMSSLEMGSIFRWFQQHMN